MDARLIIAIIVSFMVILGAIISGDIGPVLDDFYNQNFGYMLMALGGEVLLIYFIIDLLLLRDEKRRWDKVKDKVAELIKGELTGVFLDVNLATKASCTAVSLPIDATEKEERAALRKATLQKMKELYRDLDLLKKTADPLLLKGSYGTLFSERARRLGDLQLKYWSKFLEPRQMALIIDLQCHLDSLHTHISIASKCEQWVQQSELPKSTARIYEEYVYSDLQALLTILSEIVDNGMIEIP